MFSFLPFLFPLIALPAALGAPRTLSRRAVSQEVYDRLNLFEQYSAAAYCPQNFNSSGHSVACNEGNCPLVQAAVTNITLAFENSLTTNVTGFVAVDSTNDLIVVAFRGSDSVRDFLTDVDFPLVTADTCTGCEAEQGFYTSWQEAKANVTAAVAASAATYPSYEIVATGHSLGAAIATLCAADVRNAGYTVGLFTYGSPRVGNPAFAAYVSNQGGESYRVTHTDDPVPDLPPSIIDYDHIYGQYWITSGNDVPVTPADIQVFTGDANLVGNEATNETDASSHLWYFNSVGACFAEGFGF